MNLASQQTAVFVGIQCFILINNSNTCQIPALLGSARGTEKAKCSGLRVKTAKAWVPLSWVGSLRFVSLGFTFVNGSNMSLSS